MTQLPTQLARAIAQGLAEETFLVLDPVKHNATAEVVIQQMTYPPEYPSDGVYQAYDEPQLICFTTEGAEEGPVFWRLQLQRLNPYESET